ncbi:YigZ family protein [Nesterenkonia sp. NBAIMH1]|uniref:IMPACT family protein n=1 Tax=Nesterenkonia sp. NBAIMH1 TaxID=2600320 RepID=UPI0011B7195C|nr:YigZ family protein [Nesterenkonia sp. NBAIMH1]
MDAQYTALREGFRAAAEVERKKSRFLAVLTRVHSAEEAQSLVEELRREHPGARHHCSAWVIGPERRVQRANDDGEPSGTAGAPMLEALTRADTARGGGDLSDAVLVVVRWFGGTLLGSGGLVSAYSDAARAALDQARSAFVTRSRQRLFTLEAPPALSGQWENELRRRGARIAGVEYTAEGTAVICLSALDAGAAADQLAAHAAAVTGGTAPLTPAGVEWIDSPD